MKKRKKNEKSNFWLKYIEWWEKWKTPVRDKDEKPLIESFLTISMININ